MKKKKSKRLPMKFATSCGSRECRKKYKDDITEMCEAIITPHILDYETRTVTCMECGKSYKLPKKK